MCGNRIKFFTFKNFFKTGKDIPMFRVHYRKLCRNDLKSSIRSRTLNVFCKRIGQI